MPETSIIIRTFNEEEYLSILLEAIEQQTYRDFEVIIVDSGSYDRTLEIAQRHETRVIQIESHNFTYGYSLNIGIQAASGQFAAIVSAHAEPVNETWLEELVAPLGQDKVAMVYGRQSGTPCSNFSEAQDFRRTFGTGQKIVTPPNFFANNANSAVQRELWKEHPFDETLPGLEDIEWAKYWMLNGYKVVYQPTAWIYHIHEESSRQIRHRYEREALAARAIGVQKVRDIAPTLVSESVYLVEDLLRAVQQNNPLELGREIFTFRVNKTLGKVSGLLNGDVMKRPEKREHLFFDRSCKAVVIRGPGKAQLEEIEAPSIKPGEVLIRPAYVGVCGTDLEIFEGTLGYYQTGLANYPIIPGHEFSGWVAQVGTNVEHLCKADPVVVECIQSCGKCQHCSSGNWIACKQRKEVGVMGRDGAYGEYISVPGHFVHGLPDGLDMRQAALCEPIAVVLKGLNRLERFITDRPDQTCAVIGAGPIGNLCAQILTLRGHSVVAYDQDSRRRSYFKGSSIHTKDSLQGLGQFDILIEATGDPDALHSVLTESKAGATILLLGLPYARREFNFEDVVAYDRTIIGSVGSSAKDFKEAVQLLSQLSLEPFIDNILPLSQFDRAWQLFRQREHLKILLQVTQ